MLILDLKPQNINLEKRATTVNYLWIRNDEKWITF